jgi:hypothetical protein
MIFLVLTLLLANPVNVVASPASPVVQSGPRPIPVGDPQRRVLLDAMRPGLQDAIHQPVQFVVEKLQVEGDWAFFEGSIQQPNGRPIDFSHTAYQERIELGVFDGPSTVALLHRVRGQWTLVDFVVGPTDMGHWGWADQYGAPPELLGVEK